MVPIDHVLGGMLSINWKEGKYIDALINIYIFHDLVV